MNPDPAATLAAMLPYFGILGCSWVFGAMFAYDGVPRFKHPEIAAAGFGAPVAVLLLVLYRYHLP